MGWKHETEQITKDILSINSFFLQRPFQLTVFDPVSANYHPEIADSNFTIDRNGRIWFYLNVKRDIATASIHTTHLFDAGIGKQNLVYSNTTVNICTFFSNRKGSIMLTYVFRLWEKFGVFPRSCPVKKVSIGC